MAHKSMWGSLSGRLCGTAPCSEPSNTAMAPFKSFGRFWLPAPMTALPRSAHSWRLTGAPASPASPAGTLRALPGTSHRHAHLERWAHSAQWQSSNYQTSTAAPNCAGSSSHSTRRSAATQAAATALPLAHEAEAGAGPPPVQPAGSSNAHLAGLSAEQRAAVLARQGHVRCGNCRPSQGSWLRTTG